MNRGISVDFKDLNWLWVVEANVELFKENFNAVIVVCWDATVIYSSFSCWNTNSSSGAVGDELRFIAGCALPDFLFSDATKCNDSLML